MGPKTRVMVFVGLLVTTWLLVLLLAPTRASLLILAGVATVAMVALHRSQIQMESDKRAAVDSHERSSRLFHDSPMAMSLTRLDDGHVVEINTAYGHLFGVTTDEIIGRTPDQAGVMWEPGRREALLEKMRERGWVRDEPARVETRGGWRDIAVSAQLLELEGTRYNVATFVDQTERRRAEADAQASEQRFRELAENVQEVFWICTADGKKVEYANPAYERVFGRTIARLERDPNDWLQSVHPDDRPRVKATLAKRLDTRREETFRIVLPDGTIKNLKAAYFPIREEDGKVIRVAGITADITQELALEEQVRQAQKLESLGLLAGGVAHDFNNILAVVGSNAGLLKESISAEDADLVEEIDKAVKRGASLTRQLLAFSRRQVITPVVLDVNKVVEETRKMLRRMVGEDIHLSCSLDPEVPHVLMDSGALVQVLMNLVVNARDAMPRGGDLSIVTRSSGEEILLQVVDSGCGMSREVVSRIFEPFFTTKGVGKGTGLGLSVVHGIVQQAGGRIDVQSTVGVGTTFSVHLPVAAGPTSAHEADTAQSCRGDEKILLVDDDTFVRVSAARALRTQGYQVLEADGGARALELIEEHDHSISLLVTDVVMPHMDGRQLVEAARSRRPSLKVLYTSGYTDDAVLQHGIEHEKVSFLEKPFRARELAGRVRRILDGARV